MAWLESHQSLRDHPKKDRLAELLFNGSVPMDVSDFAAAGLLHYLWYWALDYAHDGDLSKFSDRQVAKGCRWNGDAILLMTALIESGFVDEDRHLHDWDAYAGRLLLKRERDTERVRNWRTERNADVTRIETRSVQGQTYRPTNQKKGAIKSRKGQETCGYVDNSTYCKCGAEMRGSGDGGKELHCPICEPVRT